jgi:FAD/FMN-containing dehydrogenase/Fe-S oxidoreductase
MTDAMREIEHLLSDAIGPENVKFDTTTRLLYSTDASNYQIIPHGVTFPRDADDVTAVHEVAAKYEIPILPRGGGTALAGQAVGEAIVMDFARHMRRVTSVNTDEKTVHVQPGMVLAQMNNQLAPLGLMFGPDPASANRATIGGCLGNNATGTHSILYRMTADHVNWLDVVLANGDKVRLDPHQNSSSTVSKLTIAIKDIVERHAEAIATRYPKTWRTCAGYALNRLDPLHIDLTQLIVGSEGTLGAIVGAELALVQRPRRTALAIVHFDNLIASLEAVPMILTTSPSAVELLDNVLISRTRNQPEYGKRLHFVRDDPQALLVVEFYGESDVELRSKVANLKDTLQKAGHKGAVVEVFNPLHQADVWYIRKAGLGLLASNRSDWKTVAVIEDAAVPVENLANYITRIREIVDDAGAEVSMYAHASAGLLHVRPLLNLKTEEGLRQYHQIGENAVEAVLEFNGTTSGEHGDGLLRAEFLEKLYGPELTSAFHEVKQLFDPNNIMNPGKIVHPPRMNDSSILRYGLDYDTPLELTSTRFDWSEDNGYAGAVEMCNGAGVCRKEDSGTMCPSFMATRDERDSTRGRANILRLAMSGKIGLDGMQGNRVKDVLDLCLSCKACKAECPSAVDMARLKAEFMAHYQDAHGIPLRARFVANVHQLNRVGSQFPRLSNAMTNLPGLSSVGKKFMGIAPERDLPKLAGQRFSQWAAEHTGRADNDTPVLLIDTFLEYYDPQIGQALAEVMTAMGMSLQAQRLPGAGCCGRPALSKGMLDQAKSMANNMICGLATLLEQNPEQRFMMVEPSCLSALRDDMAFLVDEEWQATAQTIALNTISIEEWLEACLQSGKFEDLQWDNQPRQILYHGHCHQKSLWGTSSAEKILNAIPGADVTILDAGCCGMAGSFGYEAEHYDVSMAIAEQRLYPAIRENPDAIIVASGTSCREQIDHINVKALHPVEVLAKTMIH